VRARGKTESDAQENAQNAGFRCDLSQNVLYVPKSIIVPKGQKWRVYDIDLSIDVPVGKYIVFKEGINKHITAADFNKRLNNSNRIFSNPGAVYKMTEDGLVCITCADYGAGKMDLDDDVENFDIEGPIELEIIKSDQTSIDLHGAKEAELEYIQDGEQSRGVF
jgi:hypothetical protein